MSRSPSWCDIAEPDPDPAPEQTRGLDNRTERQRCVATRCRFACNPTAGTDRVCHLITRSTCPQTGGTDARDSHTCLCRLALCSRSVRLASGDR